MPKTRFSESHWIEAVAGRPAGDWRSIAVSFGAALVTLIVATLALKPGAPAEPAAPVAVIRQTGGGDLEFAAAQLLTVEQLSRALRESQFPAAQGIADMALAEVAERVRPNLRVDLAPGGRGAPPTATIRWIGDRGTPGAVKLVNWLAQHFNDAPQAERIAAAEQSHLATAAKLREASEAVVTAENSFQRALAEAELPQMDALPGIRRTTDAEAIEPAIGPPLGAGRRAQLQTQLDELESQRSSLAERLMPAHPEMRALDTQIAAVRAKLAEAPVLKNPPAAALPAPPEPPRASPYGAAADLSNISRPWEAVLVARRRHDTAVGEERLAWQRLTQIRAGRSVEIIPASPTWPSGPFVAWWRAVATGLAGWFAGWLVLVLWPSPTAPLTTIEQVRRATRLPVIMAPSLN